MKRVTTSRTTARVAEVIRLHALGHSTPEIAKIMRGKYPSISPSSIGDNIRSRGLVINQRTEHRRQAVNDNYFNVIDSERKAYFFGLICSDGSVRTENNRVSVGLKISDEYLIKAFKEEIETSYQICHRTNKDGGVQSMLQVYSKQMVSDLIKLGCHPRKSYGMKFPQVPSEFFWDFFRGYFDGDGWVSIDKGGTSKKLSIIVSEDFGEMLISRLLCDYGIKSTYSVKRGNYGCFNICSQRHLYITREFMYNDATIYMERKAEIFYQGINNKKDYGTRLKHLSGIFWETNNRSNSLILSRND